MRISVSLARTTYVTPERRRRRRVRRLRGGRSHAQPLADADEAGVGDAVQPGDGVDGGAIAQRDAEQVLARLDDVHDSPSAGEAGDRGTGRAAGRAVGRGVGAGSCCVPRLGQRSPVWARGGFRCSRCGTGFRRSRLAPSAYRSHRCSAGHGSGVGCAWSMAAHRRSAEPASGCLCRGGTEGGAGSGICRHWPPDCLAVAWAATSGVGRPVLAGWAQAVRMSNLARVAADDRSLAHRLAPASYVTPSC